MLTDILLFLHFLGLMLGAGGGFGSMVTMQVAAKRPPEQAGAMRSVGPALGRLSTVGLILMLATGFLLVFLKYGGFAAMPSLFWVKMLFVGTLTIAAILIELTYAAVKRGDLKAAARLPRLGPMAGISSLLAVLFAALTFH
jgi:putative membrane protein